ncbi:bile acid-CoA:amino acid N-acyltransferase [Lacerta agilis]|uniref:bile acid-CoA:amino acid N-acyltransferase n=1 Tax=Lacerta agilis TaxID=80427 RepID=UPI001419B644|nr:bile acid-CoA:amino acid N-acyltransferase [Lacerta agilis]
MSASNFEVCGPGIGIVAICKGAEIALAMSVFLPQISGTVCINGTNVINGSVLCYRDLCIPLTPYKSKCVRHTRHAVSCLWKKPKGTPSSHCTLLSYPGAGCLLEPPGSPFCYHSRSPFLPLTVLWSREALAHAAAQEHARREIQKYLHLHLKPNQISRL